MMKKITLALVLLSVLAFAGCSKAPEAEMTAAQTALQAAMTAEAADYAPDAFRALQDSLNAAMQMKTTEDDKFALFRSYGASKEAFVRAEAMAKQVEADAAAAKEAMKNEVMAMMTTVQATLDSTVAMVDKAPVGKGNKAEIELIKNDLATVQAQMVDANNDFTAGKYKAAKAKLEAVSTGATRLMGEVNNAVMMKKGGK